MEAIKLPVLSYNKESVKLRETTDGGVLDGMVNWIDVQNLKDRSSIEALGKRLGIHHLIIEDVLNPNQMVKMDNYDDCLFIVLKMMDYDAEKKSVSAEHVSIVLKQGLIVSVQQYDRDIFSELKAKIREGRGNIRKFGADYLCYALIDTVVDNYFEVIDRLGDETDNIEEQVINAPEKNTLQNIYFIKRELMFLRKSVYPLRELIGKISNCDSVMLGDDLKIYMRDVYDHLIQIVDSIETYQDILSNMLDTYLSSVSNKTNDTMKILTIFSTIFIPLTFLAGIYGMNFKNIPELQLQNGYFIFWGVSIIIAGVMMLFFHKKKWF